MLQMVGHNSAGSTMELTFEQRCALALKALYGPEPLAQKVIKAVHHLQCDAHTGELFISKKDMRALLSMSKDKTIRGHRDAVYDDGFLEIEGKRGAKGAKSVLSEEEITAAVEAYRQGTSGTPSKGTSGTPGVPQVPHNQVPQVPPSPPEVPHQQGTSGTPSSRAHASYIGDTNVSQSGEDPPCSADLERWAHSRWVSRGGCPPSGMRYWLDGEAQLCIDKHERQRIKSQFGFDDRWIESTLIVIREKLVKEFESQTGDTVIERRARELMSYRINDRVDKDIEVDEKLSRWGIKPKKKGSVDDEFARVLKKMKG